MNTFRLTILLLSLLLSVCSLQAQEEKRDFFIYGAIFQKFTHSRIKDVHAELLRTNGPTTPTMHWAQSLRKPDGWN